MLESLKNKRIMIVVAHPDDELLGLGATLHKLINEYRSRTLTSTFFPQTNFEVAFLAFLPNA